MPYENNLLVLFSDSKILYDTLKSHFFFSKDKFSGNFNAVKTFTHNDKKILVADYNSDTIIDILDIVNIVNYILF